MAHFPLPENLTGTKQAQKATDVEFLVYSFIQLFLNLVIYLVILPFLSFFKIIYYYILLSFLYLWNVTGIIWIILLHDARGLTCG